MFAGVLDGGEAVHFISTSNSHDEFCYKWSGIIGYKFEQYVNVRHLAVVDNTRNLFAVRSRHGHGFSQVRTLVCDDDEIFVMSCFFLM